MDTRTAYRILLLLLFATCAAFPALAGAAERAAVDNGEARVYFDVSIGEPEKLASCYQWSLAIADELKLETIAFPSISTGVYGYPIRLASRVAVSSVLEFMAKDTVLREVIFCCFSLSDLLIYRVALRRMWKI